MHATVSAIDPKAPAYYLTYQFVPKTFSDYQFPKTLNPKNTLRQNETLIAKKLYAHLNNIIKTSLEQADRPVGLLLSGGLDSTILLYLLRKNTRRKIYTISGAYASDKSHLKLCASLAKKYNTIHRELIITPEDLMQLPYLYSTCLENPIGDNGFLATHLMFKALSFSTNTIYTGDGADCLFHGLRAHYLDFLDKKYLHRLRPHASPSTMIVQKLLLPKTNYPGYEHYKYGEIFLTKNEAHQSLGLDIDLTKPLNAVINTIKTSDPIKKTILLDLNFLVVNRADYILKAAAANKIKIVLPFLDPTLVDYVLRIPSKYFIKNSEQKYILKKAFYNELPKEVISQKKRGMTPPFLEWYSKNLSFVLKTINKAPALGIAPEYIRYLNDNISRSNQYAYGMRIWLILNLVLWYNGQHHKTCVTP
jgi:asparagine synthase (glutamine-hydrolysing)